MKLFFDTNVVLDLLAAREPFFRDACLVHSLCARGVHEGLVADFTFCTIAYTSFAGKRPSKKCARPCGASTTSSPSSP